MSLKTVAPELFEDFCKRMRDALMPYVRQEAWSAWTASHLVYGLVPSDNEGLVGTKSLALAPPDVHGPPDIAAEVRTMANILILHCPRGTTWPIAKVIVWCAEKAIKTIWLDRIHECLPIPNSLSEPTFIQDANGQRPVISTIPTNQNDVSQRKVSKERKDDLSRCIDHIVEQLSGDSLSRVWEELAKLAEKGEFPMVRKKTDIDAQHNDQNLLYTSGRKTRVLTEDALELRLARRRRKIANAN